MKKQITHAVCILALALTCLGTGAYAAGTTNSETIQAVMSYETQLKYNGAVQQLKDANGNAVFPILYNGTTYLPVRAVAGLFHTAVDWDAATGTVLLGAKDKIAVTGDMVKTMSDCDWTTEKGKLVMDGKAYEAGLYSGEAGFCRTGQAQITLNGKYQTLHMRAVHSRNAKLDILDTDGTVLKSVKTNAGQPQEITVDVGGVDAVKLMYWIDDDSWSSEGISLITDLTVE